jgi:hypothetical protein
MKSKSKTKTAEAGMSETKPAKKAAGAGKGAKGQTKPRDKSKDKAERTHFEGFDFVGKVESLVVKGASDAAVFEFGLRARHGLRKTFRLRTSDSFSLSTIAPVVTAAHAKEAKIGVRAVADEGGILYVTEVASRPKLRKAD